MRIKIDENLPLSLRDALRDLGHDVEHVYDEGLTGKEDPEVWIAAQTESRFLITQEIRSIGVSFAVGARHHGTSARSAQTAGCWIVVREDQVSLRK